MLSESQFRKLVSGQWRGPIAAGLRSGLGVLELGYGWAARRRNLRFDRGHQEIVRVDVPVISVGNLTVGGTGKTPLVAWLGKWFLDRQVPATVISRGYGSHNGRPNDEALELASRLPGLRLLQNPDRVAAAHEALRESPRQVLILDDAFQHRRLARDLDIVLLDALTPFGYEHLLPRGLLREPIESLSRAHVVALSRSDAITADRRAEIESRVRAVAPNATWLELIHRPTRFVSASGQSIELAELKAKPVMAFCGIGNPRGFEHTLASAGLVVSDFLELPDHCPYDARHMAKLAERLMKQPPEITDVVCTRKDLVKIPHQTVSGKRIWALEVELEIVRGAAELEKRLGELAQNVKASK
jgi:tetraacyldisaccharide 4'-kinase